MRRLTYFVILINIYSKVLTAPTDTVKADITNYRLPLHIVPLDYNLVFRPYLNAEDGDKQFKFDGEVHIDIRVSNIAAPSIVNEIILHSKNLNYTLKEYWDTTEPDTKLTFSNATIDPVTDKFSLKLNENLKVNRNYTLHFKFMGQMDNDMHGFYRSSYIDDNNNVKWLGSTQFQTHHARRAFPCFDEPKFKASFTVSIIRDKSYKTVSNTPLNYTKQVDYNTYADVYDRTPIMATYILAFLVSEFNERGNGDFFVIARPEYYDQTNYSFHVGQELLKQYDNYFQLPYNSLGIDKMHLAAIPDFSAGAMENWGILTYRERALLYQEGSTTLLAQQSIAAVISHEQAHMWFGDLVTCDWWSYTWLNEGFARYFQYMMTAVVHPEWQLEKQFVVDQIQSVFRMDATNSTNPMSDTTTASPTDLGRMFNSISYNKGASIIRMINHAIGEKAFKNALQEYLTEFRYKNTIPNNLLKHFENNWPNEFKDNAAKVFNSFTTQVGYPVVTVNVSNDGNSMEISQKRFLLKTDDGSNTTLLYTVPFTYTTSKESDFNSTSAKLYLAAKTGVTRVQLQSSVDWVIANVQQTGYFRVNYNVRNWHKIHHALMAKNWSNIHELNRAQFVDDLLNLARSGEIDYNLALNCLEYLETELNYIPWTAAFNGYSFLAIRLGTSQKQNFASFIMRQTERVYKKLGFHQQEVDSALDVYNRNKVIYWSCKYGNQECISQALEIFGAMATTPVPVNIRPAVYCTAMRQGTAQQFNNLFDKYKNEKVATEQTLIINALSCVKDAHLVEKYFNIIVSDDIRRQDKSAALAGLYSENPENVSPVFKLVTDNFDKLAASMGSYSSVATVIANIAGYFTTEEQRKDLEYFNQVNKHNFGSSASTLEKAEVTVKENLLWDSTRLGAFKNYLEKRENGATTTTIALTLLPVVVLVAMCNAIRL